MNASGRTLAEPDVAERVLAVLREEGLTRADCCSR